MHTAVNLIAKPLMADSCLYWPLPCATRRRRHGQDAMTERDKKPAPDRDRAGQPGETDDVIIPGRHGKHGGGMESEGSPQEQAPEANTPPNRNGADRNRH